MRCRRRQNAPPWALRALRPGLTADTSTQDWPEVIRDDVCAYCGGIGGNIDHIEPKVRGGRSEWYNLTGACRQCNMGKGGQKLLQFLVGCRQDGLALTGWRTQIAGIDVAAADLRAIPYGRQREAGFIDTVVRHLLESHPWAEGALLYGRRRPDEHGRSQIVHILETRKGGANAGNACQRHGGGGSTTRGGFVSTTNIAEQGAARGSAATSR